MCDYCKQRAKDEKAMLDEVNANLLYEGLIYPKKQGWISYILRDMIKEGWVYKPKPKLYHSLSIDCLSYPAEWLASQICDNVALEMQLRGMAYDKTKINYKWDLRYTREWEELVDMSLIEYQ